ncbi:MAG: beta-galactosidase [Anaerolineae bacterium]
MGIPVLGRLPRRLRLVLYALVAFAALSLALAMFLFSTVLAAPLPPYTPPRTIANTDVNPYGANFFLEREVEVWKRERTLSMAHDAGLTWARQQFPWEEIEPSQGAFNWTKYDDIVALYRKNGMQVIARLDRPPLWARSSPSGSGASGPPDDFDAYGNFVQAFVAHYKGQVNYIQIWNEPNLGREWNDAPIDPAAYTRLLKTAYTRAKATDPNIRVLTAPLAITLGEPYPKGEHVFRNMNDLQFLQEMYDAGARDYFDILSANAFGLENSPEDPADPGKLNFQRVTLERAIMEQNGDASKSVWIDEFGWNASPATMPKTLLYWGRVTDDQQADYTLRGIEYARKNWPWVGVISIWFFRQVGDMPLNNSEYYFRMVDTDFAPRPIYIRLKDVASQIPIAGPGQYQESNQAFRYTGVWNPRFDARASGGVENVTTDPTAGATLKFWGDAVSLLVHTAPGAGRLLVTLDGQRVSILPRDANGRSYVSEAADQEQWQVTIPVATGLSRGEHTVQVQAAGQVNLDGVIIPAVEQSDLPWPMMAPLFVLGTLGLYLLLRETRAA